MRDERLNAVQAFAASQAAVPYKGVLIRGKDIHTPQALIDQFSLEGFLIIGDGKHDLNSEYMRTELKKLDGKIDFSTRIYINAHGLTRNGIHTVDSMRTRDFLVAVARYSGGSPLSIQLLSCYGGAAALDVSVLPVGSVLLAHSPSYTPIMEDLGNPLMLESSRGLSENPDLIQDFVNRFVLNVLQTATISVKKSETEVFKHTVRFNQDKVELPTYTHEVISFLDFKRSQLVEAYKRNLYPNSNITLPKITRSEAYSFSADLKKHIDRIDVERDKDVLPEVGPFSDYINHSGPRKTPLMEAVMSGDYLAVTAILASSNALDINAKDSQGYTALMAAAINGNVEVIDAMLASDKVDQAAFMMTNQLGYTPLMMAISGAYGAAVLNMLKSEKVLASASVANSNGKTALDLALAVGGGYTRDLGNGKKVGSVNEIALHIIDTVYRFPLTSAVKDNDLDKFNQLLPHLIPHPFALKEAFIEAAINNRVDMLEQMLPRVSKYTYEKDEKIIESAFIEALKHQNDTRVLSKLLPHMDQSSELMQKTFADVVVNNDGERFKKMLVCMVQKPITMEIAFVQAILNNREDMFDNMLPHIDPESAIMTAVFIERVKTDDGVRFDKMLAQMLQKPHTMNDAFVEAVVNNRMDMFEKMLPHATPDAFNDAFTSAVANNRSDMFDKILPYIKQSPYQMKAAFEEAVGLNDADKFNKMLPHMISNPSAMDVAIVLAIIHNQPDMFDKILPHIPQDSIEMTKAVKWAILKDRADMFDKMLPRVTPRLMSAVFNDINTVEISTLKVKDSEERVNDLRTEYLNALSTRLGNIYDPSSIQWELHRGYLKQLILASDDLSRFDKGFVIRFVRSDAELIVNVINKIGDSDPWYIESLEIELANMVQKPELKQQLIAEATKSGNQELLGKIIQLDRDNQELVPGIEMGLTPDETRAALEIAKQDNIKLMRLIEKAQKYNVGFLNKLLNVLSETIQDPVARKELLDYATKSGNEEVIHHIRQYEESFTNMIRIISEVLVEAATKLGNQQILDMISQSEAVKVHMPPEAERVPSSIVQMVPPPMPQVTTQSVLAIAPISSEPQPLNMPVTTPDVPSTFLLLKTLLGIQSPVVPVVLEMEPFIEVPTLVQEEPAQNWVDVVSASSMSRSDYHDWLSDEELTPNKSGDEMPPLVADEVTIHAAEPTSRNR